MYNYVGLLVTMYLSLAQSLYLMIPFVHGRWVQKGNGDLCGLPCGFTEHALRTTTLHIYLLGAQ